MKTKVCRCAHGSWPVDCDVTYQLWRHQLSRRHASLHKRRWGRTAVQDVKKASFPCFLQNYYRCRIEIDHLYSLRCCGWYCNPAHHSLGRPARPRDGRHNLCCAGLQYQPLQPRAYCGQFLKPYSETLHNMILRTVNQKLGLTDKQCSETIRLSRVMPYVVRYHSYHQFRK